MKVQALYCEGLEANTALYNWLSKEHDEGKICNQGCQCVLEVFRELRWRIVNEETLNDVVLKAEKLSAQEIMARSKAGLDYKNPSHREREIFALIFRSSLRINSYELKEDEAAKKTVAIIISALVADLRKKKRRGI